MDRAGDGHDDAATDGHDAAASVAVDWDGLRRAALAATRHAYVPYSGFPVGAAALTDDGRIVSGCNVENASFGLTLCAECSLVSALRMSGGGTLRAFVCVNGDDVITMPCGRCRQLLWEFRGPDLQLLTASGIRPITEILPDAFGPEHLPAQS
ncbi:MAG: cytidine deaminase [Micrococcus sp.]|nr:cytidine deaminase [Micrococcus sp.]